MEKLPAFFVKWNGKEYKLENLSKDDTVSTLKDTIQALTCVKSCRQKLLGLKYKGTPPDDLQLSKLNIKANSKFMMMGTLEEEIAAATEVPTDVGEVVNDFDIVEEEIAIENREEYLAKIDRRVKEYKIDIISEPRPGKKLLVLDIDYTLFDHRSVAETGVELMRPYLHHFLKVAYEDYDIVIWSATGMKWIKAKMEELGVSSNPDYKLSFMLDSLAMITVFAPKYGIINVKPLGVIWGKYPQWSEKNTIMFDDLRRNFIMNPQCGLKIRPFRNAHQNRDKDTELLKLAKYLKDISVLDDFTSLNHKKFEHYKPKNKTRK